MLQLRYCSTENVLFSYCNFTLNKEHNVCSLLHHILNDHYLYPRSPLFQTAEPLLLVAYVSRGTTLIPFSLNIWCSLKGSQE